MGHSYKGQAVPFSGNPYAPNAGPPPFLTLGGGFILNWTTARPLGYDDIDAEYSPDFGASWYDSFRWAASLGSIDITGSATIRTRFTNGTDFTGYSNVVTT